MIIRYDYVLSELEIPKTTRTTTNEQRTQHTGELFLLLLAVVYYYYHPFASHHSFSLHCS